VLGGLKPARSGTWQARMGEFFEAGIQIIQKKCAASKEGDCKSVSFMRRTWCQIEFLLRYVAFSIHSTGQMATQRDPPSIPSHSLHFSGSITYMSPSPIAVFGHSGRQSPQAVHSSVILIAIKFTSLSLLFVFSSALIKNFH